MAIHPLDVVIMAAGKGTRMKSSLPKVLHRLGGRALLAHVLDCAAQLSARQAVVITGHGAMEVEAACARRTGASADLSLKFVRQEPQLGTGHAVQQALPVLPDDGITLVLSGDVPLTQAATLQALLAQCDGQRLALLTLSMADPAGYGRIVRAGTQASAQVRAIVEHKDASEAERAIHEIYSGIMAVPTRLLRRWLARLDNDNVQNEYYLTDIVKFAVADGVAVVAHQITDAAQVAGVNSPVQLAELERVYQQRLATTLMEQGVRLADPARLDVRGQLTCGQDVEIDVNCVFDGRVSLGQGVRIGANCVIANAAIAAGAVIHPFTHIDGEKLGVQVGEGAMVGPFARLRPGANLGAEVHIGNFVEVKNSTLARGAKANHLAYLGDATVGERVNYGAGSITANYDGANKHRTVIEADVHIGSNCVLVAPVTIGAGATVGGGSTITRDVPAGALSVGRGRQVSIANWARPVKKPGV
ncbi:bifunctional UDP-N-acetylglucosamine diphosphorylase/glucosamine-1-phosphate N-acetyltransferase GlmU [Polaromonas naphthalenivorans]|uniref:Bifunctional protein GlmU n=1 Tax=Polaromonas naphthalenivorans (strain CJ2) TaxID=365044 RepID=GLMU_POLNA|nr:bifunctional UDP-N-acetylglucosamine diphosphorylase/glucosamine-1-phosphate N-acetyltransferase GlmU [Polaromonas naphthalenivorans]A1VJM6.1 RecName: Full=Bifunctional protein GlmU; Includes: RecName: Full=UDP-N-acetylglucosamine pyrophosphorylase; AltName: Full=N-acetylglucosamine-1-phosphate uridyltransferase; Includes: RecName: Full=Glucosamine-1-phosphate N-acetyltransferase [Polaromonas naphthalenivorans CJ2]ABM35854.1 glucosamine-1-phosphate N-acetyltransferase / UDP-N-acetylglucosamine